MWIKRFVIGIKLYTIEELRESSSGRRLVGGSEKKFPTRDYRGELSRDWPEVVVGQLRGKKLVEKQRKIDK